MTDEEKAAAYDALMAAQPQLPEPVQFAGPAGVGQLSAPLQPPPPPLPVPVVDTPHVGEVFTPGELAYYDYVHPADKPGEVRRQVVMVTHVDDDGGHVHGLVLGELRNIASFLAGELTHGDPRPAAR